MSDRINNKMEELMDEMSNSRSIHLINALNNYPIIPTRAHTRPFHVHWLNIAAGIIIPISPVGTIGVGKYFSPEVGARIQFTVGQARNKYITNTINDYYHINFIGGIFDALFNLNPFWYIERM